MEFTNGYSFPPLAGLGRAKDFNAQAQMYERFLMESGGLTSKQASYIANRFAAWKVQQVTGGDFATVIAAARCLLEK
jgi:hypothetical protein